MMKPGLLLVCVSVVLPVLAAAMEDVQIMQILDMEDQWKQWKTRYGKSYSPREEFFRRGVFYNNIKKIADHNAKYPLEVSYVRGFNQFSDMTVEEYRQYNKLTVRQPRGPMCRQEFSTQHSTRGLPANIDWRTKGYVTEVKNQGRCGSCWAFSATGSVEGQHFNSTGKLVSLSEQQLIDCSAAEGNQGCDGGLMEQAFDYIIKTPGGLMSEDYYPYMGFLSICMAKGKQGIAPISSCVDLPIGEEDSLQRAVAQIGPISVGIDASHESFQTYTYGVYDEPDCSSSDLDHGVLVVGYGTFQGTDYWLVKNSWSTEWGMNGYIMMRRNNNNMCGIATDASYPIV